VKDIFDNFKTKPKTKSMKQKAFLLLTILFCVISAQSQKLERLLAIGGEADIPISIKSDYDNGFGGNLSFIAPGKKEGGFIVLASLVSYQFSFNNSVTTIKSHTTMFKFQAGAVSKLTKNLYLVSQIGLAVANEIMFKNGISPIITVGPSVFLPVNKNRVRIGAALSYTNGLFANVNAAYGFHL
jgi:hypothetical protein